MASAPYQSLYRRFRPQRFGEVRGQDHVTIPLRNEVRDDRIAHAYLFSGPRGTGKTSTARILAKALNCANPSEGEPCGTCDSCVAITEGTSFDVHEIDAATNSRVEEMRELLARSVLSTPGRWKVYIVDEVHMLSAGASNALLKTLEEPPAHVVFVLATTDPQKVVATIRSRTQHFEFHLLSEQVLDGLLEEVSREAALSLPEGALSVVRRRARGSARDALSALDQVAAAGLLEDDTDQCAAIIAGVAARETSVVLVAVDAAVQSGRDPVQLAVDLIDMLREGFLSLASPTISDPTATRSAELSSELGLGRCVRAMEEIGTAIVAMRDAPEPRITLEVALVRCAHPEADDSPQALVARIEHLERRIADLAANATSGAPSNPPTPGDLAREVAKPPPARRVQTEPPAASATPSAVEQEPPVPPARVSQARTASRPALGAYSKATTTPPEVIEEQSTTDKAVIPPDNKDADSLASLSRDELVLAWGDHVLTALRPKVRAYYHAGRFVGVDGGVGLFAVPNQAHLERAEPLRPEVDEKLSAHFKRPVTIRLVVDEGQIPTGQSSNDQVDTAPTVEESNSEAEEFAASKDDPVLPDASNWAEDRLLQAFPGAEEIRGV